MVRLGKAASREARITRDVCRVFAGKVQAERDVQLPAFSRDSLKPRGGSMTQGKPQTRWDWGPVFNALLLPFSMRACSDMHAGNALHCACSQQPIKTAVKPAIKGQGDVMLGRPARAVPTGHAVIVPRALKRGASAEPKNKDEDGEGFGSPDKAHFLREVSRFSGRVGAAPWSQPCLNLVLRLLLRK